MQLKTIHKNIDSKLNDWFLSIEDEALVKRLKDHVVITGGSIASMLLNEPVNDYDVYLSDIDTLKRLAEYYIRNFSNIKLLDGRLKEQLIDELNNEKQYHKGEAIDQDNSYAISLRNLKENQIKLYFHGATGGYRVEIAKDSEQPPFHPVFFSPNAISLSDNLQIVLRFWGTPAEIHKSFDFIHATNYFTYAEGVVTNQPALLSLLTKQLKYQGSLYPLTSIIRARKFIKRGFNISAGEYLKILFQVSQFDLSNPDVLEEQLIGVDIAYFDVLITALRNKQSSEPGFKLSSDYLNTLIERIFNDVAHDED